jgi:hypothetical protein
LRWQRLFRCFPTKCLEKEVVLYAKIYLWHRLLQGKSSSPIKRWKILTNIIKVIFSILKPTQVVRSNVYELESTEQISRQISHYNHLLFKIWLIMSKILLDLQWE